MKIHPRGAPEREGSRTLLPAGGRLRRAWLLALLTAMPAPPVRAREATLGELAAAPGARRGEVRVAKASSPGPTVCLADVVISLSDFGAERHARINFEVELSAEPEKERFQLYVPRVREAFLVYLSDRNLEDFRGSLHLGRIKQALLSRLKTLTPGVTIRGLYITELVIQ